MEQHSYAAIEPGALCFARAFQDEAKFLWQCERSTDCVTTVAGAMIYCMMTIGQGSDQDCLETLREVRQMAERLKLFGVPHDTTTAASFDNLPAEVKRAAAHTAWGTYSCLMSARPYIR